MDDWKDLIRPVQDFPAPGITFRDITPLLRDGAALRQVVEMLAAPFGRGDVDAVVGIESRGFMFGAPLALRLQTGFVPIRKLGKLPGRTVQREYALEYGTGHLEMHCDALLPGDRVLLVDDVLATGGTARAAAEMIEEVGARILEISFVIELLALGGRQRLPAGHSIRTLLEF